MNGTLYGTTSSGGASGCGTVYRISTSGSEKVLYSFASGFDGCYSIAPLIDVNGILYGTTLSGGASGRGTVFSTSTAGKEKVLYSFAGGSDGNGPDAALLNVHGTLYGVTGYWGQLLVLPISQATLDVEQFTTSAQRAPRRCSMPSKAARMELCPRPSSSM